MHGDEGNGDVHLSLNSRARVTVTMMFTDSFNINLMCSFYMPGIALILLLGISSILVVIIQQNQSDIRIIYL